MDVLLYCKTSIDVGKYDKRLLHDIFHIGPGISPRFPYESRVNTRDDMENIMS